MGSLRPGFESSSWTGAVLRSVPLRVRRSEMYSFSRRPSANGGSGFLIR